MLLKIFTIPFNQVECRFNDDDVQAFLVNKNIRKVQSEFFCVSEVPYWTLMIEYEPAIDKGEATAVLSEPERKLFETLKQWRKEKALSEGVPVYIIATNRELTELIRRAPKTLEAMKLIKGFGKQKSARYGKEMLAMINSYYERKIQEREDI